jgi:hypothetical protein
LKALVVRTLKLLFNKTINNVVFGIALMVLVAIYIALGSGFPRLREAFEMNELQFFSAWPLKLLMALLVINLAVVTWTRIPFTPPRYGVWMIHAGIITLILGMAVYYNRKVEGMTRIPVGQTVDHFYDGGERALYTKIDGRIASWHPLPSLPRFKAYDVELKNTGALEEPDLQDIRPYMMIKDGGGTVQKSLAQAFGLKDEVRIDVIGYYPYAHISTQFVEDPQGNNVGIRLNLNDPHEGSPIEEWLVASETGHSAAMLEGAEVEHRDVPAELLEPLKRAARELHRIEATAGGHTQTLFVEPGGTYPLGETGYTLSIERFEPAWPMFGTNEIVQALMLKVKSPTQEFRRMILDGHPLQTDFKLDDAAAGPMGARQKEPLDKDLKLDYRFSDPLRLSSRRGSSKYSLVTPASGGITVIGTSHSGPTRIEEFPDGTGTIQVALSAGAASAAPMMQQPDAHDHPPVSIQLTRSDRVRRHETVQVVPPAKRDRDTGAAGVFQVLRTRISAGDWSRELLVPFSQDVMEVPWQATSVEIPGTGSRLELQLGQTRLQLPAKLTLKQFDLIPYAGGDKTPRSMFRDFKSTVIVEDPKTGERVTAQAHMNNPIYFADGAWLFFQSQWDPNGQQWTVLGVGNRPGVRVMMAGFVMVVVGIMYAFYLKPVIIRRMKQKALDRAKALGKSPRAPKQSPELVTS